METVTNFISEHPQLLLAALCVCIIIIFGMYFNVLTKVEGARTKKKTKKSADSEDEEIDELIDSIHEKTK